MKVAKQDWINAAVEQLAQRGVDQVKVEVLARQLNVSKGSFYWHFKNRSDLLESIVSQWESETSQLIEIANQAERPLERLKALFRAMANLASTSAPVAVDTAIFQWANLDPMIRERVDQIEKRRVDYLTQILTESGHSSEEARYRADLLYFALLGYIDRSNRDPALRRGAVFFKFFDHLLQQTV